jgi:putative flippase GtrA
VARGDDIDRLGGTFRRVRFNSWEDIRQPVVFGVVGVSLAVIYFVMAYAGASGLGLEPAVASGISYLVMIPLAYFAHRIITFRSSAVHKVAFPRFVVSSCMGVALSWVIPYLASRLFAAPHWLSFLAVCVIVPPLSFLTTRAWVFVEARRGPEVTDVNQ